MIREVMREGRKTYELPDGRWFLTRAKAEMKMAAGGRKSPRSTSRSASRSASATAWKFSSLRAAMEHVPPFKELMSSGHIVVKGPKVTLRHIPPNKLDTVRNSFVQIFAENVPGFHIASSERNTFRIARMNRSKRGRRE